MNKIYIKQNEEQSLKLLYTQQKIYKKAKELEFFIAVLNVFIPFGTSFLISRNNKYNGYIFLINIIAFILSILLFSFLKEKKIEASNIQQKFDLFVFGMKWKKEIFGEEKPFTYIIAKNSAEYKKDKVKQKIFDWYAKPKVDYNGDKAILYCQYENVLWDQQLRQILKAICSVLILTLTIIILIISIKNEDNINVILEKLFFQIPMYKWLYSVEKTLREDINRLNNIEKKIYTKKQNIYEIQGLIFEHRKKCYLIPDIIYDLTKEKNEKIAKNIIL